MVIYYIYAKDFSGSTNRVKHYHDNGLKTLEQFKNDVEKQKQENTGEPPSESKVIYLHWGEKCVEVDEETTRTAYLKQDGTDRATCPDTIIDWLKTKIDIRDKSNKIRLIYLITDGLIDHSSINKCFEYNQDMYYESVVFHAFHENINNIDLSVAASFFKKHCMVYCNYKLHDDTDISNDYNYDEINADNFTSKMGDLESYIKLKFLKRFNTDSRTLEEIEKLKKLRARLLSSKPLKKIKGNLETKDKNVFLREFACTDWYKNLGGTIHETDVAIDKFIVTLINYINSCNRSYKFDELKYETTYNKFVEEEAICDVDFTAEQEIAFPDIILEDETGIPVVILTKLNLLDKIIFHGKGCGEPVQAASFSKFKSTMECPLFLVNDKDISESIGYFYTFNVYKHFIENDIKSEPRTRQPFEGGVVLTDTDQFDKYNDFILSATYFDSKKVNYNVGLFYYVLWKNCEKKAWMDKNVVDQFKKYAMRRISETVCRIGLSSLPLDPREITSLPTALWYCVELSSHIFKDDPLHFTHERLRMFYGVAHCMIEILKYFEYDLDLDFIERRSELMSYVMTLKKIPNRWEKVYYVLNKIFKNMDGFLVSEIEKPFNLYKLNYLKYNHQTILNDSVLKEPVHLNDYVHLMHSVSELEASKAGKGTKICDKTFRPFFIIDQNKSFYTELVNITRKVVISNDDDKDKIKLSFEPIDSLEFDRILSLYNLFIQYVKDLEKYPTLSEYVEYVHKRKKIHGDLVTIFPSDVLVGIQKVYDHYQKIVSNVEVKKFIEVCTRHVSRTERIKAEDRGKFNNIDEINEFISSQEITVNLIRKT